MNTPTYLIIRNKTHSGLTFRPSDWVDRLAATAGTFVNRRLRYNAKVMPCRKCEGHVCLRVDTALKDEMPDVFESIIQFMEMNSLPDYAHSCITYKPETVPQKILEMPVAPVSTDIELVAGPEKKLALA